MLIGSKPFPLLCFFGGLDDEVIAVSQHSKQENG
jgi:hypothetical protein